MVKTILNESETLMKWIYQGLQSSTATRTLDDSMLAKYPGGANVLQSFVTHVSNK